MLAARCAILDLTLPSRHAHSGYVPLFQCSHHMHPHFVETLPVLKRSNRRMGEISSMQLHSTPARSVIQIFRRISSFLSVTSNPYVPYSEMTCSAIFTTHPASSLARGFGATISLLISSTLLHAVPEINTTRHSEQNPNSRISPHRVLLRPTGGQASQLPITHKPNCPPVVGPEGRKEDPPDPPPDRWSLSIHKPVITSTITREGDGYRS